MRRRLRACLTIIIAASGGVPGAFAQQPSSTVERVTVFERRDTDRYWVSAQMNVIVQAHPDFPAPYSGPHSLQAAAEHATSTLLTLYTGVAIGRGLEVIFDAESAGGSGISDALGIAGFTNLDVVRNPTLGAAPYVGRVMVHQTFALGDERAGVERTPLAFARTIPVRRLEWRVGKMGTADFFDVNAVGSDSHLQFMNWTVDNNGAYDYAADTRGYTWGAVVEYQDRTWGIRFGEMLMPKVANGLDMEWNLGRARAENVEVEWRTRLGERVAVVRALTYVNHANMGNYLDSIDRFEHGIDPLPIIENTRQQGRIKYGFGLNAEQQITSSLRGFVRVGRNEPHYESFAYTEAHNSLALGADYSGAGWHRPGDKTGAAFVTNGLSSDHAHYLALGGQGFLLGDGALTYGRENIAEVYYTAHMWRGVFVSGDFQHIHAPGYNRDRGPVNVFSARLHVDM